jgi:hypothetical protein
MLTVVADNNDGITVFDITDSANPSYCFVSTFGLEAAVGVEARVSPYVLVYSHPLKFFGE